MDERDVFKPGFKIVVTTLLFLSLTFAKSIYSQSQNNIQHYTSNNGLPQNSITAIASDKYGIIWLTTQAGICSFDGQNFYHYNLLNSPALTTDRFIGFDRIEDGQLTAIDENWNQYILPDYGKSAAKNSITKRFRTKKDDCMVDHGNFFWFGKLRKNKDFNIISEGYNKHVEYLSVQVFVNEHQGYLQLGKYLYFLDIQRNIIRNLHIKSWKFGNSEPAFVVDNLLVYCKKAGYEIYEDGKLRTNIKISPDVAFIIKGFINLNAVRLYPSVVMANNNLYKLFVENDTIKATSWASGLNIRPANVKCAFYDSIRNFICVGTYTNGLYFIKRRYISSINSESISEVLTLGNNEFISNNSLYNARSLKYQRLKKTLDQYSLFKTGNGNVWYTIHGVLYRATTQQPLSFSPVHKVGLFGCRQEDGRSLWMAFDNALWKIGLNGGVVKEVLDINMHAYMMFRYSPNILWMVSNKTVSEYNILQNRLSDIPQLKGLPIRSIYRASDSSVWITTYGMGMYRWKDEKAMRLPLDRLQSLKYAHSIFEDKKGFFWISTNNGLIQCLKSDLEAYLVDSLRNPYYYRYDESDGLATNEFNGGSQTTYDTTTDGLIAYPTLKGPAFFRPLSMRPNVGPIELNIGSVEVDKKNIELKLDSPTEIATDFNYIKIRLLYPYFGNYTNIDVAYNIKGLNSEWEAIGPDRLITINRLPHGDYQLTVRIQSGFGAKNCRYKKISFIVLPKIYERHWFQLLGFAFIILFAILSYKLRLRSLTKRKEALDNEVAAKTMELSESVHQQNALINKLHRSEKNLLVANSIKEKLIGIILHDIKTPLQYLDTAATAFHKNISALDKKDISIFSSVFAETTLKTNGFVAELLQWLLSQQEGFTINRTRFSIKEFFGEVRDIFLGVAEIKHNQIIIDTGITDKKIFTDRHMLHLIVRNLIDNAIKNTKNGVITLLSRYEDGVIRFEIKDSGKGMSEEQVRIIQDEHNGELFNGPNLGISLVKNFSTLLDAKLLVESQLGKGTKVTLVFPLVEKQ